MCDGNAASGTEPGWLPCPHCHPCLGEALCSSASASPGVKHKALFSEHPSLGNNLGPEDK